MQENFFTPQNVGGELSRIIEEVRRGTPTAAFGVSDAMKYLIASALDRPFVYITQDSSSAKKARENISTLSGKKIGYLAAKDEVLLYQKALSKDHYFDRLCGIDALQKEQSVVAEIDAILQLFPKKLPKLVLTEGAEFEFSSLLPRLIELGYCRVQEVENKGTFALRGDILDIFPLGCDNPVRIDFFGDTVEKIKPYDLITGNRLGLIKEVEILSATDIFISESDKKRIEEITFDELKKFKTPPQVARATEIRSELLNNLDGDGDYVMPLIENSTDFFSLINEDTVLIFDEGKPLFDKFNGLYKDFEERFSRLYFGGEAFSFSKNQYVDKQRFLDSLSSVRTLALQSFGGRTFFFEPMQIFNPKYTPTAKYLNNFPTLFFDLKNWMTGGYRAVIFSGTDGRGNKLCEYLRDEYLPLTTLPKSLDELKGIAVVNEPIDKGFVLHESKTVVIGTGDLYPRVSEQKHLKRKRGDLFFAPEVGDYAVHETHGIGRVVGMRKIETLDGIKECIALEYKDKDMLYLPAESMDSLTKYVGEANPPLSKIGGADFERVKSRVRASLKKLAFDLKALYKLRSEENGFAFEENEAFMTEFEEAFEYELTPDQKTSLAEIKQDMCSTKVMDRLLCGDVGFGKTELAFSAMYLAVLNGKQSALMCPSTILCKQHFETATKRFSPFGVRVAMLNRFNTEKETEAVLDGIRQGKIDVLIGTHRLLSSDVVFKNLGLLVLDEEQRFGVEHKEKIKNLRKNIDCLTMTATPIPRTLHMSLTGIRDISTIETPPVERLPVQTYVVEESDVLIRDAALRELARNGQVFILYNRVESIFTFADRIRKLLPEAKLSVAHGRMDKTSLENNVYDFYSGNTNVLITTTIIENGIDLPNANTLIVIDSDRLGISQLYQLKGRVGRGTRLAHAYFTYDADKVMTDGARERLKAIMEFTELGSGYKLAVRDLEIRGAGNVLGVEQHGHMDKVGYELYSKLLKEAMTGETTLPLELDVRVDAYIPETYIESSAGRLDAYKQIAEIDSVADYKRIFENMSDVYGELPESVMNLMVIAVLKSYAEKFGVYKITVKKGLGVVSFPSINALGDAKIQSALERYKESVRLSMTESANIEFFQKRNPVEIMAEMVKFLKFALTFTRI